MDEEENLVLPTMTSADSAEPVTSKRKHSTRRRIARMVTALTALAALLATGVLVSDGADAATAGNKTATLGPATIVKYRGAPVTIRKGTSETSSPSGTPSPAPTTTTTPPTTSTPPATSPTTSPAPSAPLGSKMRFAPPALSNPQTIQVSATNRGLKLDPGKDYIIQMPSTRLVAAGGLQITGGRNVVLIGGEVHHPKWWSTDAKQNRGLYLKGQTGTIHIEGLHLSGFLSEGIDLSQTQGATVQLVNVLIDRVQGGYTSNHADIIQTWAGPRKLLIDGLTGSTAYQGFFLLPNQFLDGPQPELFDFNRIDLQGGSDSGYLLWTDAGFPVRTNDVWVAPAASKASDRNQFLWPRNSSLWAGVQVGQPSVGHFVTTSNAGVGYVSPGYVS
jgi:hypothetical protein